MKNTRLVILFDSDLENIKLTLLKMHIHHFWSIKSLKNTSIISFLVTKIIKRDIWRTLLWIIIYRKPFAPHLKQALILCKEFCKKNFNIKLVFSSFKIKIYFSKKDPIPDDFKSFLVYKFTCTEFYASYIGETCRHFKTRIEEHIKNHNKYHIFK